MAVVDRHLQLSRLEQYIVSAKASAAGAIFTTQTFASTVNATFAVGTNIDYARYLRYKFSAADPTYFSGGTIRIHGSDIRGVARTETVAVTAAAATAAARGSIAFASLASNGISLSNFSLATAASSASNSITFQLGLGNIIGLPNSIRASNAVANAWIGTTPQPGSFTVMSGDVPAAGLSLSNAIATNTPVQVLFYHSR